VLLVLLLIVMYFLRSFLETHEFLLSAALLLTLLVSPYLYNYDFLLLLVPFAVLVARGNLVKRIIVLLCYLVPTFALVFYGRNGNIALIIASIVVLVLLLTRPKISLAQIL
jgi:hypothetical protein